MDCVVLGIDVPVSVNFISQPPSAAAPGTSVALSGVRMTVSMPADVVNAAIRDLGFTVLDAEITADNINATNTTEGTVNATPTPIDFTITLVANQPFVQVLNMPATVGTWTAGKSGTITFTPGDLDVTLTPTPNEPFGGFPQPVTCTPEGTPTLNTIPIQ
jgi:hypothetical protein